MCMYLYMYSTSTTYIRAYPYALYKLEQAKLGWSFRCMLMQGTESIHPKLFLSLVTEALLQGECGFETQRFSCS